jgi:uncharacterized protein
LITSMLIVPARDGARLAADLHQLGGDAARPILLIRTPYGKQAYHDEPLVAKAVDRGYAVVVQDVRGRYASDGVFDPYRHEGLDGYDSIEWLAQRRWCNGCVATAGLSYPGAVQWLAAVESPPHLVCAFPRCAFHRRGSSSTSAAPSIFHGCRGRRSISRRTIGGGAAWRPVRRP